MPFPPQSRYSSKHLTEDRTATRDNNNYDIYSDFDSIYESMRRHKPAPRPAPVSQLNDRATAFETEQLAKSLAQVEEALQRARSPTDAATAAAAAAIPSPSTSSTYGKLVSVSSSRNGLISNQMCSPPLSIDTASELTTRADSRNTNHSFQMGPALVEEMTLSDLEDEISLSLMETSQRNKSRAAAAAANRLGPYSQRDSQYLLRTSRNRQPLPASLSLRMAQGAHQQPSSGR